MSKNKARSSQLPTGQSVPSCRAQVPGFSWWEESAGKVVRQMPGRHPRDSDEEALSQDQNFKRSNRALQNSTHQTVILRANFNLARFLVSFSLLLIYHSRLWGSTGLRLGVNAPKSPLSYGILGKRGHFLLNLSANLRYFKTFTFFWFWQSDYLHFGTWRERRKVDTKDNNNQLKTHLPKFLYPFEQIFFQAYLAYTYIFNYLISLCGCVFFFFFFLTQSCS